MNTRQGILVTGFATTLFMNFASIYWTMWSVLTFSMGTLLVTDMVFFEVRDRTAAHAVAVRGVLPRAHSRPCRTATA